MAISPLWPKPPRWPIQPGAVDPGGRWVWHTLVRVWDGQQVRQYVDGLRTNTVAVTATGSWTIYKWGWQFSHPGPR